MGIAYGDNGLVSRKLAMERKGYEMHPDDARMYNNLAGSLLVEGKVDSAFRIYDQIYDKFPDYILPFKIMYKAYEAQKQTEKAGELLGRLYDIYRKNPSRIQALLTEKEFCSYIGSFVNFLIDRGRWQEAQEVCDSLIVVDGTQVQYITMRAQCLAGMNQLDRAWDSCTSVIERWPAFGPAYLIASEIAYIRNDLKNLTPLLKKCESNVSDRKIVLAVKTQDMALRRSRTGPHR
jgi:tetratricopeptide (TPR) repeat protein